MSETPTLKYAAETVVNEALLKKTLWASLGTSWRKTYYIVCGAVAAAMLLIVLLGAVVTGEFGNFIASLLILLVAAASIVLLLRYSVGVSLRRWKEQNHAAELHLTSGFTDEGLLLTNDGNRTTIRFDDLQKVFPVDGVWVFSTKAGLLVFYNASALTADERNAVLALLRQHCPKLKIKL